MWYSTWRGHRWTPPEAIVSGPLVLDEEGPTSFDPIAPMAIVRQGNVLLVTWRTDYGIKGNGVWYSHSVLAAPELPVIPLPTLAPPATPMADAANPGVPVLVPTPTASPAPTPLAHQQGHAARVGDQTTGVLMAALAPVSLLLAVVLMQVLHARSRRRG
jgi:hypothetical protein